MFLDYDAVKMMIIGIPNDDELDDEDDEIQRRTTGRFERTSSDTLSDLFRGNAGGEEFEGDNGNSITVAFRPRTPTETSSALLGWLMFPHTGADGDPP